MTDCKTNTPQINLSPQDSLFGKTLHELKEIVLSHQMQSFVATQLAQWLYAKDAQSFDEMTNISKQNRQILSQQFHLGKRFPKSVQVSQDGTKKYLFETDSNHHIETAMIPDKDRKTVCVSSQVGCKMGCLFCMTARQGFESNLTAGEILNQFQRIDEAKELTNIVYMGMGEPLDNLEEVLKSIDILTGEWGFGLSPKRITVSTIGIVPAMESFLQRCSCHLAISLHTPFDTERRSLMPIERVYSLTKVVNTIRSFNFGHQRKLTFECILFNGINDTPQHATKLIQLLSGIRCRVNLITFHPIPGSPLEGSNEATMQTFKDTLNKRGILATIRTSRGKDIFAACGLLSTKAFQQPLTNDY